MAAEKPQEIEYSSRLEAINRFREDPIVRNVKQKGFGITKKDLDPSTGLYRFEVWFVTFMVLIAIPAIPAAITFLVASLIEPDFVISLTLLLCLAPIWLVLAMGIAVYVAARAYVTLPTVVWGISRSGKLVHVKGGRLVLTPWTDSVYGTINTERRVMYVPANNSQMPGQTGIGSVRVSLNAAVPYRIGSSNEERMNALVTVQNIEEQLFKMAEGAVSGWMREHPYSSLIRSAAVEMMLDRVSDVLNRAFPRGDEKQFQVLARQIVVQAFGKSVDEQGHSLSKTPGEEMKASLSGKIADWGLVLEPFELSDIVPSPSLAERFEEAEAIADNLATISRALKMEFPGKTDDWYMEAASLKLDKLIEFRSQSPVIFKRFEEPGGSDRSAS